MSDDLEPRYPVLLIHTRHAMAAVTDRRKQDKAKTHKIFGFKTYCSLTRNVWRKAHEDDPYADLVLIEIERRLDRCAETLAHCGSDLDKHLDGHKAGRLADTMLRAYAFCGCFQRREFLDQPYSIRVNSANPHANLGGGLIALYDLFIRRALACRHFGIIRGNTFHKYLHDCRTALRGVFAAPCLYKDLGITREDIAQQTVEGLAALDANGPVPEAVLARKLTAKFRPGSAAGFAGVHSYTEEHHRGIMDDAATPPGR